VTSRFSPEDVARLLGLPEPTPEQATVIAAPAQPMAVIAGAGSGKSETMAARLVWLVANGLVRPDRVMGLTFTRKAAAELADRVRARLDRLRRSGLAGDQQTDGDPVISTYHAYAGRLVGDHALREGLEPSMRLITPAESWQLAARIVAAYDGPMGDVGWGPPTVTAAVLALAGELSEHLREPADVRAVGEWLEARRAALGGRLPAYVRKMQESQRAREQLLPLAARYAAAKAAREVLDHGDQMALAARIASRHPQVGLAERGRYQPRAAGPAAGAVRRRPSRHGRRRPVPVHLRLARRQRGKPAPLRAGLPGAAVAAPARCRGPSRAGAAAVDELP